MLRSALFTKDNIWAAIIFIVAAYLALFNLGYAPLWHDEGPLAVTGKNIVLTGGYNAWDGRNLYTSLNGLALSTNFKLISYPPWQALPSALGIAVFGNNEVGVRFFHSVLGLLSLLIFWRLLRLDFANEPRLRVLAFTLFALSAQTLLFMRQGRYAADSLFFALLMFYFYRLYISDSGRLWHLAIVSLATVLGFFNHYAIGGSFALALGTWHLCYHFKHTNRRQWLEIIAAAVISGALCFLYLVTAGIILSDEKLEFSGVIYEWSWLKRHAYLIFYNFRELLTFGWLPLWVALWFLFIIVNYVNNNIKKSNKRRKRKKNKINTDSNVMDGRVIRWSVLLALFLFFSGMLAIRAVSVHQIADSRYIVPALPFTALIMALFINWFWQRIGGLYAVPLLLLLLTSNVLAFPYIYPNLFTQQGVRLSLPKFIAEIHRPYDNYTREVLNYLNKHVAQDDTIFVTPWQDFGLLQFYLSDKLIFCCALDSNSNLPEEKVRALGAPIYKGDVTPVWQVRIGGDEPFLKDYQLVHLSNRYAYPMQRPELEFHAFSPTGVKKPQMRIYRRLW